MDRSPKKLALRRIFESEPVDIILLQETLGEANHVNHILEKLKLGWTFLSLNVVRRFGGLALGFSPHSINLKSAWGGKGFIGIGIFSADLGMDLRVINVYGPCHVQEAFWNQPLNLSITSPGDIIICGDLNFSIKFNECWDSSA